MDNKCEQVLVFSKILESMQPTICIIYHQKGLFTALLLHKNLRRNGWEIIRSRLKFYIHWFPCICDDLFHILSLNPDSFKL